MEIYNLFKDGDFVASFTDAGRGFRYAENIAALESVIPEVFRSRWTQDKKIFRLMRTGFELRWSQADPILDVDTTPEIIEGEINDLPGEINDLKQLSKLE